MKKTIREELDRKYTVFSGGMIPVDSYPVQLALHHMLNGILPCSIYTIDQKQVWSCEHTGKVSLKEYCKTHELKKIDVLWILEGVMKNLQETQDYLLDADSLYMDSSEIYVDPVECRVWNMYIPFFHESVWNHMKNLTQFLLGCLDQQDAEAVHLLYGVYQYLAQGGTEIEKIWELLYEKDVEKDTAKIDTEEKVYVSEELKEYLKRENKGKIAADYEERVGESEAVQKQNDYSYCRWIIAAIPMAAAVFIFVFITLNEWYLSTKKKLVLLLLSGILICLSLVLWKCWKTFLHKKNPLDNEENISQNKVSDHKKTSASA